MNSKGSQEDENASSSDEDTSNHDNKENDNVNDNVANMEDDNVEDMEEDNNDEDQGNDTSMGGNESASQEGRQEQEEEYTHAGIINEEKSTLNVTNDGDIQMKLITPFPLTYQIGERHVFAASKGQGAMPSSSTQNIDKVKQKMKEEEENHEEEREFEIIHIESDDENETRIENSLLQDQNAQIKDLEAELERENDVIHFYETRTLRYHKEAHRA